MTKHIDILAYLYIVLSALGLLAAVVVFLILLGGGLISGEREAFFVTTTVGLAIAGFVVVLSLPGIFTGFGLLRRRNWARTLAIILGILNVLNFPLGTALAVYTFWVVTNEEAIREFRS